MGGIAASKGFEYQDLCALYRVVELYEVGQGQTIQVEDSRTPAGQHEPWDFRVINPAERTGRFTTELWQAKNTAVPKNQCCVYWKNLHKHVHDGKLEIAASADIKNDTLLGVITSSRLQPELERFRQFLECLRGYDEMPDRHDLEDVWREDYKGVDLDSLVKQLTSEKVNSLSLLDFTSRNNGSVFWFRRFTVEEWTMGRLRERIENLCGRRLGMRLEDLGTGFEKLFGSALSHIRKNYGKVIPFDEIITLLLANGQTTVPRRTVIRKILDGQARLVEPVEGVQQPALKTLFVEPAAEIHDPANQEESTIHTERAGKWLLDQVSEAKRKESLILLLGDFGHGKTSLAKITVAKLASKWKAGDPIPVFVPLRRCFEDYPSVHEMVVEAVSEDACLDDETWRSSHWLIFCDGFDELNTIHQDRPDWIRHRFHKLYTASLKKNITIVIGSRPILFMDLEDHESYLRPYLKARLLPFDKSRIKKWIANWAGRLTYADIQSRKLSEVASTPVILLLIAQLAEADRLTQQDYSRAGIYSEFFAWVAEHGGVQEPRERRPTHTPINMDVLRKIAVHLSSHPEAKSGTVAVEVLLDELNREFGKVGEDLDSRLFVRHAFREGKVGYIEFLHQSLREYLVADYFFHRLFAENDGDWNFQPDFAGMLIDRPLTKAEVSFFRELVEALAKKTTQNLLEQISELHWWPSILRDMAEDSYRLAHEARLDPKTENAALLTQAWHSQLLQGRKVNRVMRAFHPEVALGNAVLLHYLAQVYYSEMALATDPNRLEGLCGLIRFLSSDPALLPLLDVLKSALLGFAFETENDVTGIDFSGFDFKGCTFNGLMFQSCIFKQTSFERCTFKGCTFSNCYFEAAVWKTAKLSSTVFSYCRFIGDPGHVPCAGFKFLDCTFPVTLAASLNLKSSKEEAVFSNFEKDSSS